MRILQLNTSLTVKALKYCLIVTMEIRVFSQFETIIDVLVCSFRFIRIPMLWVYGQYSYFYSYCAVFSVVLTGKSFSGIIGDLISSSRCSLTVSCQLYIAILCLYVTFRSTLLHFNDFPSTFMHPHRPLMPLHCQ